MSDGAEYFIWSNEHEMWWGPNRAGYAYCVTNAGRYTRQEALDICRAARGGWPVGGAPPEMPILAADAIDCRDFAQRAPAKPKPTENGNG